MITAALPYVNGPLHLGHLAGAYLPADIYARYCRLAGKETLFICGSDENGVAITISAEGEGVSPQVIITVIMRWRAIRSRSSASRSTFTDAPLRQFIIKSRRTFFWRCTGRRACLSRKPNRNCFARTMRCFYRTVTWRERAPYAATRTPAATNAKNAARFSIP